MEKQKEINDLIIVGCGPAGLSAAVNANISNVNLRIFGSELCSPKMYKAPKINNYLGYHEITGNQLRKKFLGHVKRMGIEPLSVKIDKIFPQNNHSTRETYAKFGIGRPSYKGEQGNGDKLTRYIRRR